MKVHTTEDDLNALAKALDSSRKNAVMVSVPRISLANLICDAGQVFEYVEKHEKLQNKSAA